MEAPWFFWTPFFFLETPAFTSSHTLYNIFYQGLDSSVQHKLLNSLLLGWFILKAMILYVFAGYRGLSYVAIALHHNDCEKKCKNISKKMKRSSPERP